MTTCKGDARGFRHVYGPVPSKRLRRSLGLDLVPYKTCTYNCLYCQLGRTAKTTLERKEYVPAADILHELKRKLAAGGKPDYISLAGSGEPALNSGAGRLIDSIKDLTDIPVAVFTNGSLLWMDEVAEALMRADVVLPSLDAADEALFQRVNRPHGGISFARMADGLTGFTKRFGGEVWLEVFLLAGITGMPPEAQKLAALAKRIGPARVQLNTVTRPAADASALPVSLENMRALKKYFPGKVDIISEKNAESGPAGFSAAEDEEILALLRRRPCAAAGVAAGLGIPANDALKRLERLAAEGKVNTTAGSERNRRTASGKIFSSCP